MKSFQRSLTVILALMLIFLGLTLASCGEGGGSSVTAVAPTAVGAVADNGAVTVSWEPAGGATSYNVYYGTDPGVLKTTGTKVANAASPQVVSGLTNDTTYFFMVTAANEVGESSESGEVIATPLVSLQAAAQGVPNVAASELQLQATASVIPGSFAYITGSNVSVIDTATNRVTATIPAGGSVVALNPAGTRLYVGSVSVIDTATRRVIATIPVANVRGMAVNPLGTRVYVAFGNLFQSSGVAVIDAGTNKVITTIPIVGGVGFRGVAVNPAGTRVYVADISKVYVINAATNTVITSITGVGKPGGVAVNSAGTRLYVANGYGTSGNVNTVSVINTSTNTVIATIPVGIGPTGIAVNPAGTRVYVTNEALNGNTVSVIDTSTNRVIATITVGLQPFGVDINPAGTRVYVANYGSNNVSVIDTSTNKVIATVPVGSQPISFGNFI